MKGTKRYKPLAIKLIHGDVTYIRNKEYGKKYGNNFVWGHIVIRLTVVIIS